MKYAVVSDIHANRQAWSAVLLDIRSQDIDGIICLGDVVGYGPSPAEVMESVYTHVQHFVLGNHDAVLAGILDAQAFNDNARRIIEWSSSQLGAKAPKFLANLPLVLRGAGFAAAHAEFAAPGRYRYIFDSEDTELGWAAAEEQVLFVGHTHVPRLFVIGNSATPHLLPPQDFQTEADKRYIVNVGSVGQPRDGDMRASYAVFDTDSGDLLFRRIPFDVDAYRQDLERMGLPEEASYFLAVSDRQTLAPVREALDFKPPAHDDAHLADNVPTQILDEVVKSVRRWRWISAAAMLVAILAVAGGVFIFGLQRPSGRLYAAEVKGPLPLPDVDAALLSMPKSAGPVSDERRLESWSVHLASPAQQSVSVEVMAEGAGEALTVFRITSNEPTPVRIISPPVQAGRGMRFTAKGQFRRIRLQDGYVEVAVVECLESGGERLVAHRQPRRLEQADQWLPASVTMPEGLRENAQLQYVVQGKFVGEILLRKLEFFRRE